MRLFEYVRDLKFIGNILCALSLLTAILAAQHSDISVSDTAKTTCLEAAIREFSIVQCEISAKSAETQAVVNTAPRVKFKTRKGEIKSYSQHFADFISIGFFKKKLRYEAIILYEKNFARYKNPPAIGTAMHAFKTPILLV